MHVLQTEYKYIVFVYIVCIQIRHRRGFFFWFQHLNSNFECMFYKQNIHCFHLLYTYVYKSDIDVVVFSDFNTRIQTFHACFTNRLYTVFIYIHTNPTSTFFFFFWFQYFNSNFECMFYKQNIYCFHLYIIIYIQILLRRFLLLLISTL